MEKGIDDEEKDLYKQTDKVADNVMDSLNGLNANVDLNSKENGNGIDYNKLLNIMTTAFSKALSNCKFTLDEDGFARIVKEELYKVV